MHHFHYQDNVLHCEQVPIPHIAKAVGTPFYLYSHATLERHFRAFDNAFQGIERLVCYSAKANTSQAILTLLRQWGSGLDIVSGGELQRGLIAGFAPRSMVYSGVGKRIDEIDCAISQGILMFNIESLEELQLIDVRAGMLGLKARVAIRINPDVDPQTHPYISTGLKKNKFGIDIATSLEGYDLAQRLKHIQVVGMDCHLGSQITSVEPFEQALESLKTLLRELNARNIQIQYLDMGGGLGITYHEESPPQLSEYAQAIKGALAGTTLKLILEPGRVIVGNAGILVTQALYRKEGPDKTFVIVDAGMNDLMRPTLYGAYHEVQPVVLGQQASIVADVVGPICESGDFLAQGRAMATVQRGDLLAVMSAGAYGFAMSSSYCSRPRVAEVMVKGSQFGIIRQRETCEDLVRNEQVPEFLTLT